MTGLLRDLPERSRVVRARHGARAWKFGLVGATGMVVNMGAVAMAAEGARLHYLIAVVLGTQASTIWNFLFTDRWVFGDRRETAAAWRRFRSFWAINNLALLVRAPLVATLTSGLGIHYLASNLVSLLLVFMMRYAASEAWIWRLAPIPADTNS